MCSAVMWCAVLFCVVLSTIIPVCCAVWRWDLPCSSAFFVPFFRVLCSNVLLCALLGYTHLCFLCSSARCSVILALFCWALHGALRCTLHTIMNCSMLCCCCTGTGTNPLHCSVNCLVVGTFFCALLLFGVLLYKLICECPLQFFTVCVGLFLCTVLLIGSKLPWFATPAEGNT